MKNVLKKIVAKLPFRLQQEMKRVYMARQIRKRTFVTTEQEFGLLQEFLSPGDWVLDVGANVGHYTAKMSELVGKNGRVFAFEPVPETFELLAANAALMLDRNITLMNVAASDDAITVGMNLPKFDSGLTNFYMANIDVNINAELNVQCIALDSLCLQHCIKLVKIDAEGHELSVLKGMESILERDHPILIIEDNIDEVKDFLTQKKYLTQKLKGSPNLIFRYRPDDISNGGT